ncbi:Mur ligase domain-containing protein [Kitasatospora sp. NPDC091335]|uniref:Mur ligase domain-containing protein n=1 Tax=Kitasatospora sp. NPDC091335 TaxID=3364085 RepID=UPI003802D59C
MESMDAVSVRPRAKGRTKPAPDLLAKAHLVDVTAPGMEVLALWLASRGLDVTGSIGPADQDSAAARLREAGVNVEVGFDARNVQEDRTCVVWSGVVAAAHPELDRAQELKLPVLARAHALAVLAAGFGGQLVAVGGSHGTATAAAVLAAALDDGRTGWILNAPAQGGPPGHGGDRRLVVDLCPDTTTHEAAPLGPWSYRPGTAHRYRRPRPAVTLITSATRNAPHFEDTIEALNDATNLARSSGTVVLPLWDKGAKIVHERLTDRPGPIVVTVGLDESADVWVLPPRWLGGEHLLTLHHQGARHQFTVQVTGRHHALAVCAAIATALVAGESPEAVAERLASFRGVERSLSVLGTRSGITVADSRARHPHEIAQDVTAVRMLTEGDVVVVLEPDGIARTSAHADDLGAALGGADRVLLLPVSTPLAEHDGPDPLDAVERAAVRVLGRSAVHRVRSGPGEPDPARRLVETAAEGDLVLVVGTGRAEGLGPHLLDRLGQSGVPDANHP